MKKPYIVLALALLLPLGLRAALLADDEAEAKAAANRTETLLEDIDCASKKDKLFMDYLGGGAQLKGPYKFRCAKGKETITAPLWLAGEISSMTAREVQIGKDTWSEAKLWQEPLAALYDFSELLRKTRPVKDGGMNLPQKFTYGACVDALVRMDRAMANLRRERLAGSFGGRGDLVYASLEKALAELDNLEKTYDAGSQVSFYEKSAAVLRNAEEAFGALFTDAPAAPPDGGAFSANYYVAPRLLDGGRVLAMSFPAYELEGVKRGDRVDLLVTYDNTAASGAKETITATIIQAVPVLSVTRPQDGQPQAQASVRLILSPVQAQYAALAAVQARELRLAVRPDGDTEAKPMEAASFKKIIK
jgi:hypothetical protein